MNHGLEFPTEDQSSGVEHQRQVDDHFESSAAYWKDVYQEERLFAAMYRERREKALTWVSELQLAPDSRVLEVGCGAGLMTTALAERGYTVHAMDSARAMIENTRREAKAKELSRRVSAELGDVHNLEFRTNSFDLVIALGVIPWLHSEDRAVSEMARVLKPGGFLLASADNRPRLTSLLDPQSTPLFAPVRRIFKRVIEALRSRKEQTQRFYTKRHAPKEIDSLIAAGGLQKIKSDSLGFGPFMFFEREFLPDRVSLKLHRKIQRLADRGVVPGLALTGSHYLILARKPGGQNS